MLDLLTIQSHLKTHIAAAGGGWQQQLSWAYRCAMMANRLCRLRKKQGYGR